MNDLDQVELNVHHHCPFCELGRWCVQEVASVNGLPLRVLMHTVPGCPRFRAALESHDFDGFIRAALAVRPS